MHIAESGSGSTVLLLHGAPSPSRDFAPLVARLAPRFRVLVADLPGYGGTPALDGEYSIERVCERLESALSDRRLAEVALVGSSAGACVALRLALRGRVKATRVVALGGFAALDDAARQGALGYAGMLRSGADVLSEQHRQFMAQRMLSPAFAAAHAEAVKAVGDWLTLTSPAVLADELEASAAFDVRGELATLRCPLLALVGELDAAAPRRYSEELAKRAPQGTIEVLAGCGHAMLLEQPEATAAAVERALETL